MLTPWKSVMSFPGHWQSLPVSDAWSMHWNGPILNFELDFETYRKYLFNSISPVDPRSHDRNPDMVRFDLKSTIHVL